MPSEPPPEEHVAHRGLREGATSLIKERNRGKSTPSHPDCGFCLSFRGYFDRFRGRAVAQGTIGGYCDSPLSLACML